MNFYEMRDEFDLVNRTLHESDFDTFRDRWLNLGWRSLSETFVIPALLRNASIDSVAQQAVYPLPYDYNGTEVSLVYDGIRLDPYPEQELALNYERRSGLGRVQYYDWTNSLGEDYSKVTNCTLVNGSKTVLCVGAAAAHDEMWVRFDPDTSGAAVLDPGDYGYRIASVTVGVSYTLDREYRGPAGTAFTARVRPGETQQFIAYGKPTSTTAAAFTLKYYAAPRRLFNDADVPEWPSMGQPIVYMAVSIGLDYLQHSDLAKVWWGRAMNKVTGLQRRREHSRVLVTDLTIGSMVGRKTGPYGVTRR